MRKNARFKLGVWISSVFFGVIVAVCGYYQLALADEYSKKAEAVTSQTETIISLRGDITDRKGRPIVSNRLCLSVEADGSSINSIPGVPSENFDKNLIESGERFIAARDIGSKRAAEIAERQTDGVSIVKDYTREYSDFPRLSHLLGYVGLISSEEYDELSKEGYKLNSFVGKAGVEKICEPSLRGFDGKKMTRLGKEVYEQKPQNGCTTYLTVDKKLQEAVEAELSHSVKEVEKSTGYVSGGAAVVLNVKNGEVLAMASYPDYAPGSISEDYGKLLELEGNPLLNRCISGVYEPGSTFKPLVALAALNEGVVTADEKIEDTGIYTYYSPTYTPTCHIWNEKRKTHGFVDVTDALAVSCNCYFYEAGRRLTISKIAEYAGMFGLGEKCGIELEGEAEGNLASPETKEEWYAGDTLQAAIGQSVNMFTPLQLATYIGAVANGGTCYRPYIIKQIISPDGEIINETKPEITKTIDIPKKHFDTVKQGMRKCVLSGTAASSFEGADFTAAGKTGSAQVPEGPENGLFVGFAPFEQPEIAISVVIEHGAGAYASSLSAKIFDKYMDLY